MTILKLKYYDGETLIYLYQPEGKGDFGEITHNFKTKETTITKSAENHSFRYDNNAVSKIKERVEKRNFPIELIQAWY